MPMSSRVRILTLRCWIPSQCSSHCYKVSKGKNCLISGFCFGYEKMSYYFILYDTLPNPYLLIPFFLPSLSFPHPSLIYFTHSIRTQHFEKLPDAFTAVHSMLFKWNKSHVLRIYSLVSKENEAPLGAYVFSWNPFLPILLGEEFFLISHSSSTCTLNLTASHLLNCVPTITLCVHPLLPHCTFYSFGLYVDMTSHSHAKKQSLHSLLL
jgi:hypothetical protein